MAVATASQIQFATADEDIMKPCATPATGIWERLMDVFEMFLMFFFFCFFFGGGGGGGSLCTQI